MRRDQIRERNRSKAAWENKEKLQRFEKVHSHIGKAAMKRPEETRQIQNNMNIDRGKVLRITLRGKESPQRQGPCSL